MLEARKLLFWDDIGTSKLKLQLQHRYSLVSVEKSLSMKCITNDKINIAFSFRVKRDIDIF